MGAWRKPRVLAFVTWGYIAWSLIPVLYAVRASLGADFSAPIPSGFTFRWYGRSLRFDQGDTKVAFEQTVRLALLTVLIAVPLGSSLALALRHLRARTRHLMIGVLFTGVALPQAALAVALFYLFVSVAKIPLTTPTQLAGHVTLALPFVTLIVYTRLVYLDPNLEEMAMDLGAPPSHVIRRVLLPALLPALTVAAAVAFALSFNTLPLSDYLCLPNSCRTLPSILFSRGGAIDTVPPPVYALTTMATVVSLAFLVVGIAAIRLSRSRGRA